MDKTCKERINKELNNEITTLRALWAAYRNGEEETENGNVYEHGLSFDYVAPHTFNGQRRGYFRYQISWGGPSDEFRFYAEGNGYKWSVDRIEYVFMDWSDGSKRTLSGNDYALLHEIFQSFFVDAGSAGQAFEEAMA